MSTKPSLFTRTGEFFTILGAARNVSAAVRSHRAPLKRDLEALGIDAENFRSVRL